MLQKEETRRGGRAECEGVNPYSTPVPLADEIKRAIDPAEYYRATLPDAPELKPKADGWTQNFLCPLHEDQNESFGVNLLTGAYRCFGCEAKGGSVIDHAMNTRGLDFDQARAALADEWHIKTSTGTRPAPRNRTRTRKPKTEPEPRPIAPIPPEAEAGRPQAHPRLGQPSATWTYRDIQGRPLAYVYRFEITDKAGKADKTFRPLAYWPERPTDNGGTKPEGWDWLNLPEPRPLHRLDALAANPDAAVLICEGEKAADAAAELLPAMVTTTTPNGAQSPTKADFGPLKGRRVHIWPDCDDPGTRYAETVARLAYAAGAECVSVLDLASLARDPPTGASLDLPKGFDAADALAAGWTPEALAAAVTWKPIPRPGAKLTGGETAGGEEWPELQPLIASTAPEPYPLDALPAKIRAAVEEVQAFVKAPACMVASSALGALSVAASPHVDVVRAECLKGPSSLFLLTVADSGERKSTCDDYFSRPIREYQAAQAERMKPELALYAAETSAWAAEREGILNAIRQAGKAGKAANDKREALADLEASKPDPVRVPALLRGDDTPENLAWTLAREWPAAGILSSEAGVIFGAHGMGKDSIMRNLALLNILWDGGELSIGRRTKESFTVRGARLTMALQIQESTLRSFFDRSRGLARGTGFLARFLLAWPESTQGFRPFSEPPSQWPALAAYHRRLTEILEADPPIDDSGALNPQLLRLSPEAKGAWVAFHDAIEEELRPRGELFDVRDVASKTADNAARLAALFHFFEHGLGGAAGLEPLESAARIVAWHLNEARRFLGELALPTEINHAARLDAWLVDYCRRERTDTVPRREVQRHITPAALREGAPLSAALVELLDLGRAREVSHGRQKLIQVRPELLAEVDP